jgi:hypothetical protein
MSEKFKRENGALVADNTDVVVAKSAAKKKAGQDRTNQKMILEMKYRIKKLEEKVEMLMNQTPPPKRTRKKTEEI